VSSLKTNKVFGRAQIALFEDEYEWAQHFLKMKNNLLGGETATFWYFTSKPNPCKNLKDTLENTW